MGQKSPEIQPKETWKKVIKLNILRKEVDCLVGYNVGTKSYESETGLSKLERRDVIMETEAG